MRIGALAFLLAAVAACQSTYDPANPEVRNDSPDNNMLVSSTIHKFVTADPGLQRYFDESYAFAIYPKVGKAGAGIGGAGGDGLVYEQSRLVATSRLSQATLGLQLGGQKFSQVVFFRDEAAFAKFKMGGWRTSRQASAVLAKDGRAKSSTYQKDGIKVFMTGVEGAMAEASIGGQRLTYKAK